MGVSRPMMLFSQHHWLAGGWIISTNGIDGIRPILEVDRRCSWYYPFKMHYVAIQCVVVCLNSIHGTAGVSAWMIATTALTLILMSIIRYIESNHWYDYHSVIIINHPLHSTLGGLDWIGGVNDVMIDVDVGSRRLEWMLQHYFSSYHTVHTINTFEPLRVSYPHAVSHRYAQTNDSS